MVFLFNINVCVLGGGGAVVLSCLAIRLEIPSKNASDGFAFHEILDSLVGLPIEFWLEFWSKNRFGSFRIPKDDVSVYLACWVNNLQHEY